MKNQKASGRRLLTKDNVINVLKFGVLVGVLYALYYVYSGMLQLVQLLKTMMIGWAVMLEVLVNSDLLDDAEMLHETINWLMDMNQESLPSLFF
ncbi:FAD linked oxidase domain-containing protein [Anopheles sinensis]|uniref:FAD linked oxidase domain-containing protein n=1 Tax=Anopheles sinensis TaxID=74873 RepID=A0A084VLV0_ANOSI|nr:FAD linked oxidase domain-containing protein [Anopheles sinensis]